MNKKINFHTHTNFCDGKATAEEMVISAINKGISILGFSGHCIYPLTSDFYKQPDDDWHMSTQGIQDYKAEIKRLKEKYSSEIQIFTGFEADFFCHPEIGNAIPDFSIYESLEPDYLIGSVHFVNTPKGFYTVDHTVENVRESLKQLYGYTSGSEILIDNKKAVCDYFEAEREMLRKGNFNIWGHPDLIRKRNGILKIFDENESWYKEQIQETVKVAAKTEVVAEINTGAIGRGIMDDVYPSKYFLDLLFNAHVPICVNSDSHSIDSIDCAFDKAYEIARKAGYTELIYPTKNQSFTIKL